ncbi:MAG: DegT/DnrJ/EryC1/StrS family aminotransferase [Pseudomonadota bacterium]
MGSYTEQKQGVYNEPVTPYIPHKLRPALKKYDHVVTIPSLPQLSDVIDDFETIWATKQLTNNGPFVQEFELALSQYLDVPYVSLTTNATIALMCALGTLETQGEVITTPFTFPATTHAIRWAGLDIVFADIDPSTGTLDPAKVSEAITPSTCAILPVHCFGNCCDVEAIDEIASHHGLKVIYDAAASFGVEHQGRSVFTYGDLSVLSLHATKVLNTFEGGAIFCSDPQTKQQVDRFINNGLGNDARLQYGLNGKMSELNAVVGLHQLPLMQERIEKRRQVDARYRELLEPLPVRSLTESTPGSTSNYTYFPIQVPLSARDRTLIELEKVGISTRKYFHPLTSDSVPYSNLPSAVPSNLPAANTLAQQVLCLPLHEGLTGEEQAQIVSELERALVQ